LGACSQLTGLNSFTLYHTLSSDTHVSCRIHKFILDPSFAFNTVHCCSMTHPNTVLLAYRSKFQVRPQLELFDSLEVVWLSRSKHSSRALRSRFGHLISSTLFRRLSIKSTNLKFGSCNGV